MRHPRARSTPAIEKHLLDRMWPGVGGEAERTILSGATNEEALRAVLDRFPTAKTTIKGVVSARARLRKKLGEDREPTDPDDELSAIWSATANAGDHNAIVRLLMLTGQRREEVAAARWTEIDSKSALWRIPAERTKNNRAHEVPLSKHALAIFGALAKRQSRDLIFGEADGPFSGWSKSKERLDRRSGVSSWTLHDLRRTVVTGMAEIGVQPHIVEAVVNHLSGHKSGVAGIYNRATYAEEKRNALQKWAEHLASIVDIAT